MAFFGGTGGSESLLSTNDLFRLLLVIALLEAFLLVGGCLFVDANNDDDDEKLSDAVNDGDTEVLSPYNLAIQINYQDVFGGVSCLAEATFTS